MAPDKHKQPATGVDDKASMEATIEKIDRQIRAVRAFDLSGSPESWHSGIDGLQRKVNAMLGESLGAGTPEYRRYVVSEQDFVLDMTFGNHYSVAERRDRIGEGIAHSVANLTAVRQLLEGRLKGEGAVAPVPAPPGARPTPPPVPTAAPTPAPTPAPPPPASKPRMPMSQSATVAPPLQSQPAPTGGRVVVLGLGGDVAGPARDFLEQLGLEAAVLATVSVEQLDSLRDAAFLLVLPGEEAEAAPAMLAIGFMLAVLGRSRIACLQSGQEAVPTVLQGATTIAIEKSGLWRLLLAREMKRAGLDVDLNRAV
jgi:hypothetical protein